MGKNGNERLMFCDAADGNGDSWLVQLPNTTFPNEVFLAYLILVFWDRDSLGSVIPHLPPTSASQVLGC